MKNQLLTICLFLIAFTSLAQTGIVKGFIYDQENGEAVLFTNVYLKGTKFGASTDVNGFFFIDKVPAGTYTIEVSYLGFAKYNKTIIVKPKRTSNVSIHLEKSSEKLDDVLVSAKRQEAKTEVKMSVIKISPKEISALPSMGSEPDLAQVLQTLPGVIFTGDQGGQLYIRGGSPIQNKVLLDGMTIYQPFHSIGFFSVFETDVISNADIYTGGFNAQYGGRISSIMDITLRDGNKQRIKGKISASTFGANLVIEGPLKKKTKESPSSLTYLMYGKTSYMEQSSKYLYPDLNEGAGLPFSYNDLYGKLTFGSQGGSKVSVFGFNFADDVTYKTISDYSWDQWGIGTKIVIVPENVPTILTVRSSYSNYKVTLDNTDNYKRTSSINGFDFGLNLHYFMGKNELDYGIEIMGGETDFRFANSIGRLIKSNDFTTEVGAYIKPKFIWGNFVVEPGLRLHYYSSMSNLSFEPRIGIKYNVLEFLRLKLAGGFYSQNLIAATSDRDVVNLFYGFLSGPSNLPKSFKGKAIDHKLQKSKHLIIGTEIDLSRNLNLNIEGYYKFFDQLSNINRNKIYDNSTENQDEPEELRTDYIIEEGDAYGIDFVLNYNKKDLTLWAVYSHGYVNRDDGSQVYRTHFDRRHNVNFMGSYKFGKKKNWEVGARWNYGSGFPFTPVQGYYEMLVLNNNIDPNVSSSNGKPETIYGELNSFQLADYHRFDLSIKKKLDFDKKGLLTIAITVTNVYDRNNIFYVDAYDNEKVYQLPLLPSMGISYKF